MLSDLWYKNAIVYALNVETFMDGNGDGCGDFEGLARRLDYLESLGVDALWLAPFQPSPLRDDGYDISDYYNVATRLGSSGRLRRVHAPSGESRHPRDHRSCRQPHLRPAPLVPDGAGEPRRAHARLVRLVGEAAAELAIGQVFPGVQRDTWTRDPKTREWYFHRFYDHEPDLNMQNPHVREELRRIMGYWLQLGVAGFRVDALPFLLEKPSLDGGRPGTDFDLLHQIRDMVQWRRGDAVLLAEANVPPDQNGQYFADGDGVHMMFNFWVNQHLFCLTRNGDARPLAQALRETRSLPEGAQWAHFLRNHDELDLGHLDDDVRSAVFDEFGPEPSMQLYDRGIRRRLAPMLGDRRRIELAYSLLFSLPGTPVLRYGDEIGMGDNLRLRERMAIRTPMQWSAGHQAGFSSAKRTVLPVIQRGLYSADNVNVEQQWRDPVIVAALDKPSDPRTQGVPRDRVGHLGHRPDAPAERARDRVRLAGHVARLPPQLRRTSRRGVGAAEHRRAGDPRKRVDRGGQPGRTRRHPPHRSRRLRLPLVPDRRAGIRDGARRSARSVTVRTLCVRDRSARCQRRRMPR